MIATSIWLSTGIYEIGARLTQDLKCTQFSVKEKSFLANLLVQNGIFWLLVLKSREKAICDRDIQILHMLHSSKATVTMKGEYIHDKLNLEYPINKSFDQLLSNTLAAPLTTVT